MRKISLKRECLYSKEEYSYLNEELIHLDNVINNTINFFYVFLATFLSFVLKEDDTIYLLLSHIVIIPAYLLVISKRMAMNRTAAYIQIFYEGKGISWQTRVGKFQPKKGPLIFHFVHASHFPFIMVNFIVLFLFLYSSYMNKTYDLYSNLIAHLLYQEDFLHTKIELIYETSKLFFEVICTTFTFIITIKNRNLSVKDELSSWEDVKAQE